MRGKEPEDDRLFSPDRIVRLKEAAVDVAWLLGRGYSMKTVIDLVGGHHQLKERQRLALEHGVCSEPQYRRRAAREVWPEDAPRRPLAIDGFNLVITIETALSGGIVLQSLDGVVRDLAGVHRNYHPMGETEPALGAIFTALKHMKIKAAHFYLDEGVSNSGRLRDLIVGAAKQWRGKADVELVPDPDVILKRGQNVVTGDSAILDECTSWFNLAAPIVEKIPNALVLKLQ
jgi:hypothetical protein